MYVIFLNAYLRMEEEEHRKDTGASREEASGLNRGICSLTTCRQVQNVHTASPLPSTRYQLALLFSPCFTTTQYVRTMRVIYTYIYIKHVRRYSGFYCAEKIPFKPCKQEVSFTPPFFFFTPFVVYETHLYYTSLISILF